jgi:hypothetical protein
MPCIAYVEKKFRPDSLTIINRANQIIRDYLRQGFKLTLRQLYYQFIARDLLPDSWIDAGYNAKNGLPPDTKNTMKNYKRLGDVISDGRLAGKIDWDAIEDRTRNLQSSPHWASPRGIVRACADQYAVNLWDEQAKYVEVWVEKEALIGVLEGICTELDVPYFACKGYTSQSEMWGAAQRLIRQERAGKETIIVHLGDHDPSGIDMTRDVQDRLDMFGSSAVIHRIALNFDQVENYNPPPNPAKTTDARYESYAALHGDESWELDALEPRVIVDLIREEVESHIDHDLWQEALDRQQEGRRQLGDVSHYWDMVIAHLNKKNGDSDEA